MRPTSRTSPAALLLLTVAAMLATAHTVETFGGGGVLAPRAASARQWSHPGLGLIFGDTAATRRARAKQRAEGSLIDFVELMWPILDPGQPFVRTWVQEAICAHLEAVTAGRITKLLVNVPPGFTKSRIVNVMWPAWEWGPRNRPDLRYMAWSYDAKLSQDQNDDCRKVIQSELYQSLLGQPVRDPRRHRREELLQERQGRLAAVELGRRRRHRLPRRPPDLRRPAQRPRRRLRGGAQGGDALVRAHAADARPQRERRQQGQGPVLGARGARPRARGRSRRRPRKASRARRSASCSASTCTTSAASS
jgi:hypothetical protein